MGLACPSPPGSAQEAANVGVDSKPTRMKTVARKRRIQSTSTMMRRMTHRKVRRRKRIRRNARR